MCAGKLTYSELEAACVLVGLKQEQAQRMYARYMGGSLGGKAQWGRATL